MLNNPFKRAKAMMQLVFAAMTLPSFADQQVALAQIGPYKSRGKGEGTFNRKPRGGHMQAVRAATNLRNKKKHRASGR